MPSTSPIRTWTYRSLISLPGFMGCLRYTGNKSSGPICVGCAKWGWVSAYGREHAIDHHRGLAEIVGGVAERCQRRAIQMLVDLGVRGEQVEQRTLLLRGLATDVVDQVVRVFAPDVRPQAHHHGLAHHEPVCQVDVATHRLGIDLQPLEHEAALL